MNRSILVAVGAVVAMATVISLAQMEPGAGGMGQGMGPGMMAGGMGHAGMSVARHRYTMQRGIPEPYAGMKNPLASTPANIDAGRSLFQQNCASCHGATGRGDGPAAAALNPPPSDLSSVVRMPIASDAFLDWTVSEGGVPIGSAMPAFKSALTDEQRWQLVLFLRTL